MEGAQAERGLRSSKSVWGDSSQQREAAAKSASLRGGRLLEVLASGGISRRQQCSCCRSVAEDSNGEKGSKEEMEGVRDSLWWSWAGGRADFGFELCRRRAETRIINNSRTS